LGSNDQVYYVSGNTPVLNLAGVGLLLQHCGKYFDWGFLKFYSVPPDKFLDIDLKQATTAFFCILSSTSRYKSYKDTNLIEIFFSAVPFSVVILVLIHKMRLILAHVK